MKTKEQKIKNTRRKKKEDAKGITLIALIITIIVLIILAGVSIAMLVGDNGIITQARRAKEETANSTIASEEQMNALVDELNGYLTENEGTENPDLLKLKAGDYIKYNSGTNGEILCRVLYPTDSEYGLQIISDKNVKDVTLGVNDDFEASKTAYNNAIETLNNEAEAYINPEYALDARCVGSVPTVKNGVFTDKNSETVGPIELQFEYKGSTSIDCKGEDRNYETDKEQMEKLNLWTIGENYWLASRIVDLSLSSFGSAVRIVSIQENLTNSPLCLVFDGDDTYGYLCENGLRPCILLKSDIKINVDDGKDGTSPDKAYVIE